MENNKMLLEALSEYVDISKGTTAAASFDNKDLTLLKIRDRLLGMGRIVKEDKENQLYIIALNGFVSSYAQAAAAIHLSEKTVDILSYAQEGLIKLHISEKNLIKLKNAVIDNNIKPPKKINVPMVMIIGVAITSMLAVTTVKGCDNQKSANNTETVNNAAAETDSAAADDNEPTLSEKYMNAVTTYNNVASAYNEQVKLLDIANLSGMPDNVSLKSTDFKESDITEDSINTVTEELAQLVYDYGIINDLTEANEEWVITKLQNVPEITGTAPVTSDNDPNGLLNKENSYFSCVYFSINSINQKEIPGNTLVAKGTDAGGSVELYNSVEDARARCEYLGQFDNTLLYTGSYTILGKMVIRTSYKLSNEEQLKLTERIVDSMISQ